MQSIKSQFTALVSLAPAARTATTNGTGVDLQGVRKGWFLYETGAWTDGTHTPKLQESSDNSSFSDVAAADLDGSFTAISSSAGQNATQVVGYLGMKRYIRLVVTRSGTTTGMLDAGYYVGERIKQP